jgi:hypothetical protein
MNMDTPARYRIKVQGTLRAEWAENVGGLTVTSVNMASDIPETTLEGHIQDQAALTGLLVALYELHLPLMSVEYLKEAAA